MGAEIFGTQCHDEDCVSDELRSGWKVWLARHANVHSCDAGTEEAEVPFSVTSDSEDSITACYIIDED